MEHESSLQKTNKKIARLLWLGPYSILQARSDLKPWCGGAGIKRTPLFCHCCPGRRHDHTPTYSAHTDHYYFCYPMSIKRYIQKKKEKKTLLRNNGEVVAA